MINHVNHHCKEAVEKSPILPICQADERRVNYSGGMNATVNTLDRRTGTEVMQN
jgi:hypothetical protein